MDNRKVPVERQGGGLSNIARGRYEKDRQRVKEEIQYYIDYPYDDPETQERILAQRKKRLVFLEKKLGER